VNWVGRTAVVTGGLGFVGSHFVQQLLARGAEVICLHRTERPEVIAELDHTARLRLIQLDLLDESELRAACRYAARRVDAVVHCAALDGNAEFKRRHSARILDENMRIASNVLGAARRQQVDHVVLMSSAEVYAPEAPDPVAEEDDFRRHAHFTENGYALSKVFTEILADLHRKQFGMTIHVPRPSNVYGPRDGGGRVIPAILGRLAAGEEVVVWGDGRQTRSFVHVEDLVRTTLAMIATSRHPTVNVGGAESVSIVDLVRRLAALLGRPERIRLDLDKPAGSAGRRLDLRRMNEIIDFTPRPLPVGLADTVAWFLTAQRDRAAA
jgi:dTDP-4-dehydro-6-deoxy-alpha-D-gulose 4-ketoreductase